MSKIVDPKMLPGPESVSIDSTHKEWRFQIIDAASQKGVSLSHGVAAKIINVYLKT